MHPGRKVRLAVGTVPVLLAIGGLLLAPAGAIAGDITSVNFFHVEVSSTLGSDEFFVLSTDVPYDPGVPGGGGWQWSGGGIEFDNDIASLDSAVLTIAADPQIALGFTLTAGAADTTVTVTSAIVSFDAMVNPDQCFATAGATITDNDVPLNGATLSGLGGDVGSYYVARYNEPGGSIYAEFIPFLESVPPDSSNSTSGSTFGPLAATVTSMQVEFQFELSANDQVSATSNYIIMPEPAGLLVLAIGGLLGLRRRV